MWLRAPRVHPEGIGEALRVTDVFGDIQEMMQACPPGHWEDTGRREDGVNYSCGLRAL